MTTDMVPIITKCSSYLAFIERTGKRREMYRFATDSSKPNSTEIDTLWINQKRYNFFNVRFSAMFTPPGNMMRPNYVQEFKLGIVSVRLGCTFPLGFNKNSWMEKPWTPDISSDHPSQEKDSRLCIKVFKN